MNRLKKLISPLVVLSFILTNASEAHSLRARAFSESGRRPSITHIKSDVIALALAAVVNSQGLPAAINSALGAAPSIVVTEAIVTDDDCIVLKFITQETGEPYRAVYVSDRAARESGDIIDADGLFDKIKKGNNFYVIRDEPSVGKPTIFFDIGNVVIWTDFNQALTALRKYLTNPNYDIHNKKFPQTFTQGIYRYIASCDLGRIKNDGPGMYLAASIIAGVHPGNAIVVDDRQDLLNLAKGCGMAVYRYEKGGLGG